MQITPQPYRAKAHTAMSALLLLLAALPCQADISEQISVGGRAPRPPRAARVPRAARPPRGSDAIAPPPEQPVTTVEPPASEMPTAPPTDVAGGAACGSLYCAGLHTTAVHPIWFFFLHVRRTHDFSPTSAIHPTSAPFQQAPPGNARPI